MAVEDDAGVLLFGEAYGPVMVCVEQVQNLLECSFAVRVLKDLRIDSHWVVLANLHGELDLAMDDVVFLDAASQKSDDDDGRDVGFFNRGLDGGANCASGSYHLLRRQGCCLFRRRHSTAGPRAESYEGREDKGRGEKYSER